MRFGRGGRRTDDRPLRPAWRAKRAGGSGLARNGEPCEIRSAAGDWVKLGRLSALGLAGLAAALALVRRASRLPPLGTRPGGHAIPDVADTRMGRALAPLLAEHAGLNGVHALPDGRDALALRLALADAADASLDVQYYLWENDLVGTLLMEALRRAAARGVRVRLLLDDSGIAGMDAILAEFDAHAQVEVRLFNPSAIRKSRTLGYVADFARLNRRMHNKSFTADGQATAVGGRNIGDRYFAAGTDKLFLDLDVLCIGPAATGVSNAFERYWNSGSAYPAALILPPATKRQVDAAGASAAAILATRRAGDYVDAMEASAFVADLVGRKLAFDWAEVRLLGDDPAKALREAAPGGLLIDDLEGALGHPAREVGLVSGPRPRLSTSSSRWSAAA